MFVNTVIMFLVFGSEVRHRKRIPFSSPIRESIKVRGKAGQNFSPKASETHFHRFSGMSSLRVHGPHRKQIPEMEAVPAFRGLSRFDKAAQVFSIFAETDFHQIWITRMQRIFVIQYADGAGFKGDSPAPVPLERWWSAP